MGRRGRGRDQGANTGLGRENPVQEYSYVEKLMSPRKRGRGGNTGQFNVQSPKPQGARRWLNPSRESRDHFDPISDEDDNNARDLDKTTPQVVLKGYGSSSHDLPGPKPNTGRARADSRGSKASITPTRVIGSDGSVDDLSAEHYKAPPPNSPDKRGRSKYFPPGAPKDAVQAQTINDTSDEENRALEKGNIKPTAFAVPKKANAKERKLEERYHVLQVLSPSHTWLPGDDQQQWTLIYDISNDLIRIEGEGAPSLTMAVNGINIIEYSRDSSRIIIRKGRDHSDANDQKFNEATNIFLTLGDSSESVALAKRLTSKHTIKSIRKERLVSCVAVVAIWYEY
jgi:hypothetical protein